MLYSNVFNEMFLCHGFVVFLLKLKSMHYCKLVVCMRSVIYILFMPSILVKSYILTPSFVFVLFLCCLNITFINLQHLQQHIAPLCVDRVTLKPQKCGLSPLKHFTCAKRGFELGFPTYLYNWEWPHHGSYFISLLCFRHCSNKQICLPTWVQTSLYRDISWAFLSFPEFQVTLCLLAPSLCNAGYITPPLLLPCWCHSSFLILHSSICLCSSICSSDALQ